MTDQMKQKFSSIFEKIGALSKIQRLLIVIATFLLLAGVYYLTIFKPRYEKLETARAEFKKHQATLKSTKQHAAELEEYEKRMAMAQEEFNIAVKALPDKKEVPALLTSVSKAGTTAGLSFQLFQPTAETSKEFYKEIPINIKVEGRYHQITDFFYQIARLDRIVNIADIKISSKKNEALDMDCKAITYMFVEKQETEAQGKKGKTKRKKR